MEGTDDFAAAVDGFEFFQISAVVIIRTYIITVDEFCALDIFIETDQ